MGAMRTNFRWNYQGGTGLFLLQEASHHLTNLFHDRKGPLALLPGSKGDET
jgi:hypothetical protein